MINLDYLYESDKKVLLILGAGVATILIVAGVLYLDKIDRIPLQGKPQVTRSEHERQPTPRYQQQPTSQSATPEGWRIYKDKQLGFSIEYPTEGWSFEKRSGYLNEPLLSKYPSKEGATIFGMVHK